MSGKKLLYVYIEEFRGFCEKEFNFSAERRFQFEKVGNNLLLKQDESVILPEGFWGSHISEVNLLIGNNGAGKTRVIKTICQWMCQLSKGIYPEEKGIFVFQEENDLEYIAFYQGNSWDISIAMPEVKKLSINSMIDYCNDLMLVYFSNTMTELDWDGYDILLNYSMPHRIVEANEYRNAMREDIFAIYKQYEFNRQYNFLRQYDFEKADLRKPDNGVFPKYIQMEIRHVGFDKIGSLLPEECKGIEKDLSELWDTNFGKYIQVSLPKKELLLRIQFLQALLIGILCKLLRWEQDNVVDNKKKIVNNTLREIVSFNQEGSGRANVKIGSKWLRELLKDLFIDCRNKYLDSCYINKFNQFWGEQILENINAFIDMILDPVVLGKTACFDICNFVHESLDDKVSIWQMNVKEIEIFHKFWDIYTKIAFCMENVYFYWSASSGQQNWMNLFSILCDKSLNDKNIWFFLDEPDNTFHPEWERNLLDWIVKSCERSQCSKDIQIFVSTHSPIMLSDVPETSVSYLTDENKNFHPKTFGQNLYVLFSDVLCLQKGVMGAFASNKIIDVLREMKDLERDLFYKKSVNDPYSQIEICEKMIELVAEPLFKSQMQAYLLKCKELAERK